MPAAAEPGSSDGGAAAAPLPPPASKAGLAAGAADAGDSSSSTFAACVLQLLKAELRGCADVPKLLEGAALLAQLACVPQCSAAAIQSVMVLLVNRYPKVCEVVVLWLVVVKHKARRCGVSAVCLA